MVAIMMLGQVFLDRKYDRQLSVGIVTLFLLANKESHRMASVSLVVDSQEGKHEGVFFATRGVSR